MPNGMNPKLHKPDKNKQAGGNILKSRVFQVAMLAIVIFIVFSGTIRNGFVWDDDYYIYRNPLLTEPGGLAKIWKSYYAPSFDPQQNTPQYYPLVFTTFYLEHKLWGFNPAPYHITNVLLHIADTILLLMVLQKLGISWYVSLITAVLFGIHPTQVESVAWATERKNVLAGLFYFGALLSFLHYQDGAKIRYYLASLVFFVCALLSKTASVMLPVVLLLAAYLKERPIRKTIFYAIPFFALSAAAGLVTLTLEHTMVGAKGAEWSFPLFERILIVSHSIWFYIGKILWPHPISFIYGQWEINTHSVVSYLPLIAVIAALVIFRKKLGRLPAFSLAYFVIVAAPALGFVSFYMMRYTFVADHFIYLASWSIMLLVVSAAAWFFNRLPQNPKLVIGAFATILVLICFAVVTADEVRKFKNVQTLWEHTIAVNPKAWLAHNNLGVIYAAQGQYAKALEHYKTTIEINPDYATAYNNAGVALVLLNQPAKAIDYYKTAIELQSDYGEALYNFAVAYSKLEKNNEAVEYFKKALQFQPENMSTWYNLAICLSKTNRVSEAAEAYRKAVELDPKYPEANYNLAVSYQMLGKLDEAAASFKKALELRPNYIEAKYRLALVYRQQGKLPDAAKLLHSALEQEPEFAQANYDLGLVYFGLGQYENAKLYFRIAENQGIPTPDEIRQSLYNK